MCALKCPSYVLTRSQPNTHDYTVSSHIQDTVKALLESRSVSPEPIPPEELLQALAPQPEMESMPCAIASSSSVPVQSFETPHEVRDGSQLKSNKSTTPANMLSPHLYREHDSQCAKGPTLALPSSRLCGTCKGTSLTLLLAVNSSREIAKGRLNAALVHPICKLYSKHSLNVPIRMSSHHCSHSESRYLPLLWGLDETHHALDARSPAQNCGVLP